MRPRLTVFPDASALGISLAERIAGGIEAANAAGRRFVLGCPSGRSPRTTYAALADIVAERGIDLSALVIAMMDEYVRFDSRSGSYVPIDDDLPHSCRRFGREDIVAPLSSAAGQGRGIRDVHFWIPDPADPGAYDDQIAACGGVDLFILATGASDGHVAFNPPGSAITSGTRLVTLPDSTRRDNLQTFPSLRHLDEVPTHGVTVGVGTIRRYSRSVFMVVHGEDKIDAVARLASADGYDPSWPSTVLSATVEADLFVDEAAAAALQRS